MNKGIKQSFVKKITNIILLTFLLAGLLPTAVVLAQSSNPPTDDEVNAIAKQLYCPVCENIPLDVCPTQACAQWREMIREKLEAGWTEAEIKQYFVDQYGDRVLAEPPRTGLNWLVYILPPLIFLGGAYLVFQNLKKLRSNPEKAESGVVEDEVDYIKEIEDAIKALEHDDK